MFGLFRFKGRQKRALSPRKAFEAQNVEASERAHALGKHKEFHSDSGTYISDLVLGGIDGIVTTFAIVAGVEGADLSPAIVIILGFANVLADGASMAIGNFLGARSEIEYFKSEREREMWEVENLPEHEREEIREIYARKGFSGDLLEKIVERITSNKELWVTTMMREELGIIEDTKSPFFVGLATFCAFIFFGCIPLFPYLTAHMLGNPADSSVFWQCVAATGIALFGVGVLRAKFTFGSWVKNGIEILFLGGLAGTLAYLTGLVLRQIVG